MDHVIRYLAEINRLSALHHTVYRGHADANWKLKPSIGRNRESSWTRGFVDNEQACLNAFKRRAKPHLRFKPEEDIDWLALMQHHGCPTRLLDFTTNPLIALFFASDPAEDADGLLITAKCKKQKEIIPEGELFTQTGTFTYFPGHVTERIIGQAGCFIYCGTPNQPLSGMDMGSFRIPKDEKKALRFELAALDVTHATLFPGLDGICADLKNLLLFELQISDLLG